MSAYCQKVITVTQHGDHGQSFQDSFGLQKYKKSMKYQVINILTEMSDIYSGFFLFECLNNLAILKLITCNEAFLRYFFLKCPLAQ